VENKHNWIGASLTGVSVQLSEEELGHGLRGRTLQVYWYMPETRKPVTGREVQRSLKLSSPSLAIHHLEKLTGLGLTSKNNVGQYYLNEEVKTGLLGFFIRLGKHLIPRYALYVTYFVGMLGFYLVVYRSSLDVKGIYVLTISFSSILVCIYELMTIRRTKTW
jgi:hypothetical protein